MPGLVLFLASKGSTTLFYVHVLLGSLFTVFDKDPEKADFDVLEQYMLDAEKKCVDALFYWHYLTGGYAH